MRAKKSVIITVIVFGVVFISYFGYMFMLPMLSIDETKSDETRVITEQLIVQDKKTDTGKQGTVFNRYLICEPADGADAQLESIKEVKINTSQDIYERIHIGDEITAELTIKNKSILNAKVITGR